MELWGRRDGVDGRSGAELSILGHKRDAGVFVFITHPVESQSDEWYTSLGEITLRTVHRHVARHVNDYVLEMCKFDNWSREVEEVGGGEAW